MYASYDLFDDEKRGRKIIYDWWLYKTQKVLTGKKDFFLGLGRIF